MRKTIIRVVTAGTCIYDKIIAVKKATINIRSSLRVTKSEAFSGAKVTRLVFRIIHNTPSRAEDP